MPFSNFGPEQILVFIFVCLFFSFLVFVVYLQGPDPMSDPKNRAEFNRRQEALAKERDLRRKVTEIARLITKTQPGSPEEEQLLSALDKLNLSVKMWDCVAYEVIHPNERPLLFQRIIAAHK